MSETFHPIPGFPDYRVSNLGTVRRNDGLVMTASKPRNSREYPCVYLRVGGQRKRVAVHRLVALTWVGPPPFEGAQVRHLDGNPLNPRADNLAWGSAEDNAADRDAHGRTQAGERHWSSKLTDEQRNEIGKSDELTSVLAERYGVHRSRIQRIRAALRARAADGAAQ
jgi:hypothetical protein